jgi:hypothetical protein
LKTHIRTWQPTITRAEGLYFMAADAAYVLATVFVLVAFPATLSTAFAVGEYLGTRRLPRSRPAIA